MREIHIKIDKNGKVEIEAEGYQGSGCEADIDELLGDTVKVDDTDYKNDYYGGDASELVGTGV